MGRAPKSVDDSVKQRLERTLKQKEARILARQGDGYNLAKKSESSKKKEKRALATVLRKEGDVPSLHLAKGKAQKEQQARLQCSSLTRCGRSSPAKKS